MLGMGDVVGLMRDFEQVVDHKKAEERAAPDEGQFTLDDFLNQVRMIQQMGSIKDLMEDPRHEPNDAAWSRERD